MVDVGQNLSGWAAIDIEEARGTEVRLRYAEDVDADGNLDTHQIDVFVKSGAFQTDEYIAKGTSVEHWAPRFVYHGFRYIEIEGLSHPPTADSVRACVVHTDLPTRGAFECSNPLLNQIQQAARWSTLTNYHSIPTDCPHREKNGWTGDASLSAEQVLLNFNPLAAYRKWLHDIQDVQRPSGQIPGIVPTGGWGYNWGSGPAWDSALFLIPWYVYVYDGDDALLRMMYPAMARYFQFAESMLDGGIANFGLGDWCPPTGGPGDHACPTMVTDTAYVYVMAGVLEKSATMQGLDRDATRYRAAADRIRRAFRQKFVDEAAGQVLGHCQTSTATALYQGLLDPEEVPKFLKTLLNQLADADYHLDTGILGAKYVMHLLTDHGFGEIAYRVASQTTFPSWGHWIQQGATTLWEMWNGDGSHNHHMFSDISAWFYQALAGILPDPDDPGFHHIWLRPQVVSDLAYARAYHDGPYGRIRCAWEKMGDTLRIEVSVPANSHATLIWPEAYAEQVHRVNSGPALAVTRADSDGRYRIELGAGDYVLTGNGR
jgi:alpha-L-rhamnosidase